MLKSIYIKNINSIKECRFSFTRANYKFGDNNILGNLVNPISIYGHNGSGKTSFLNAVQQFISLITFAPSMLSPFVVNQMLFESEIVKIRNNQKYNEENLIGTIAFEYDLDGSNYEYLLSTSRIKGIVKEYLKKDGNFVFEREMMSYTYQNKNFKFKDGDSLIVPLLRKLAPDEIDDERIQKSFSYFNSFAHIKLQDINLGGYVTCSLFNNKDIFDLLVEKSKEIKDLLEEYKDFPIYEIKKNNNIQPNESTKRLQEYRVELLDNDGFKVVLPFNMISNGMRNNSILLSLVLSMPENSVIFIDELESALHPSALEAFIKIVQRKKIQLVFSSHNTNILQYLRPDQVYFTKWKKGFSSILRLSDIYQNIREVNNIEKMYLSGVFDEAIKNNE